MKCQYKVDAKSKCDEDATDIAYNSRTEKVLHVCSYHAERIGDMGDRMERCPNCGCVIPVYE